MIDNDNEIREAIAYVREQYKCDENCHGTCSLAVLCKFAEQMLSSRPVVDVEKLRKDPTQLYAEYVIGEADYLASAKAEGWNDCLDHLQSRGHLAQFNPPNEKEGL